MKLAFVRSGALALAFSTLLASTPAHAEVAEARAAVMLRDHPNASGKVVDRIASGAKLTMIETSDDGAWARVKTKGGHEGWVPIASIRTSGDAGSASGNSGGGATSGSSGDSGEALVKHRDVRSETWVSNSKYHDDNDKMTVVATKAELFGRPQSGGTVVGLLRRGEVVSFVRKSPDKKWVQIDMGAGELAWVDAKAVRMGADMPSSSDDDREAQREADRQRDRDRPAPQQPRSSRHADATPNEVRHSDSDRDDTPPPRRDDDRDRDNRARDDRDRDSRARDDDRDRDSRARDDRDRDERDREDRDREERDRERDRRDREDRDRRRAERDRARSRNTRKHGPNYIDASVNVGFGKVGEQVRTNSTSVVYLRNYQHLTTGLAIGATLGYARAFSEHLRLHVDFKYTVVAIGSVLYTAGDGTTTQLGILDQNIGGGVAIGGWWNAAGGIDLRLRVGVDAWINQISPSNPPLALSQDVILGMKIGGEFAMPAFVTPGDRPLGFRLHVGALAPATRTQQPGLLTAPHNTTLGGYFGFAAFYGLIADPHKGQLHIQLAYDLDFAFSHFHGACAVTTATTRQCRDDTVSDANYSSVAHVGTIGLYYQY